MVEHDTGSREVSNAEFKHAKQLYGADIVGGSLTTPVNRGFESFNPATPKKALDEMVDADRTADQMGCRPNVSSIQA